MSVPAHTTADAPDPVLDRLAAMGSSPGAVIGAGALSVVLGVLVLAWPRATITVIAWLFALQLLVAGVLQLITAFSVDGRAGSSRVLLGLLGALSILVGLLCLRAPLQTALVLGLLIGAVWVVGGVIGIVHGIAAERGARRGWTIASGVLSLIAGAVVLVYPGAGLVTLIWLLGIVLVVDGAFLIAKGFASRRSGSPARTAPAVAGGPAAPSST
jgi:uncharacterized membrane protein HdeD (DUF308 family)